MYAMREHEVSGGGHEEPCSGAARDDRRSAPEQQAGAVNDGLRCALRRALGGVQAVLVRPWRRSRRPRAPGSVLLSLNDQMLADIGLRRSDLQGLSYGVIPVEQLTPVGRDEAPARKEEPASISRPLRRGEGEEVAPRREAA